MKFRTMSCERKRFPAPIGSRYAKRYQKTTDGELMEAGVEDVYDSIQKAALGITLNDLIRRAQNGDTNAIGDVVPSYADLSKAPKDLLEAHAMLSNARASYDSLPLELRNSFGNSFDKFIAACADGSVVKALSGSAASKADTVPGLSPDEIKKIRESLNGGTANA